MVHPEEFRFSIGEKRGRDVDYISYGRPNRAVTFESGLPIHLIVAFLSPEIYKGNEQHTFNEMILVERDKNNPFCLI